jgi:DNA helicase-2/ATP-dependent DNA helicase PcrA
VGGYNCQVLTYRAPDDTARNQQSVRQVIENFIIPAASGILDINEELIEDFPRDQVPILSIHQSKGLEFPMVIVDVGSAFKTNHAKQRFRRFPDEPGAPQAQESLLRPFSPLGPPNRGDLDRAFDDLYRLYFVAFSRAMNVLLLVGTNKSRPDGAIMNVALGWNRKGQSTWADTPPYMEI